MPISNESNKILPMTNGLIKSFSFTFKFFQPSDIQVSFWAEGEAAFMLEEGTHYNLIYTDPEEGGFIELIESSAEAQAQGAPKYPGTPEPGTLLIERVMPLDQQANIRPVSGFPEEVITNTFDKLVMIDQQQQEQLDRCIKVAGVSEIKPDVLVEQVERIYNDIDEVVAVANNSKNINFVAENGEVILNASEETLANADAAKEAADLAKDYADSFEGTLNDCKEQANRAGAYAEEARGFSFLAGSYASTATQKAEEAAAQARAAEAAQQSASDSVEAVTTKVAEVDSKIAEADNRITEANSKIVEAEGVLSEATTKIAEVEEKVEESLANAEIAATQAGIAITQAENALTYSKNAKASEENAIVYRNDSRTYAETSSRFSNIAEIWAEGTDEEVQALGGEHSSKKWAEISADKPALWGNIIGDINSQTDLKTALENKQDKGDFLEATTNAAFGIFNNAGTLTINKASDDQITSKTSIYRPLTPKNIDLLVKTGITTNAIALTDEEKQSVKTWLDISAQGGSGFNLFDTKLSDHILEGDELKGWALQGTYVYKEAVAGSRDGCPDFYNKVVEKYNGSLENKFAFKEYASSNVLEVKGTNYNSLREDNGVYSGFASGDYITLPTPFNPETNTWEIQIKFSLNDNTALGGLFCTSVNYDGMLIRTTSAGKLQVYLSSNGSKYNIASEKVGTYVFETDKDYWLKAKFDGSQYVFSYSLNGVDFIDDVIIESTSTLYSTATDYRLGHDHDEGYCRGNIDLKESYIKINDELWWQGANFVEFEYSVNANGQAFYDVSQKDKVDEVFNVTGLAWLYGVDTENERVFLPRNNWFEQVTVNVLELGKAVKAGVPNITGDFGSNLFYPNTEWHGAFYRLKGVSKNYDIAGGRTLHWTALDASKSSSVYGNSDTVQPNAIKKLLYICVGNTKVESAVTDVIDVTTTENDTVPLFTGQYFDFAPNNLSWLKGGEQANSGDIYTTAYNELVNCLNGVNKYNLKVINTADMVSGVDYSEYWKVNQAEMYFITPTKLSYGAFSDVASVVGNGMALGITNGTDEGTLINYDTSNGTKFYKNSLPVSVGEGSNSEGLGKANASLGITTDETKSGIEAHLKQSTAELYFKVANAVQNLELLNVGEVLETVNEFNITKANTDLSNCTKPYVIEVSDKSILPSWYRVWSDGWCEQGSRFVIASNNTVVSLLKPFVNVNNYNLQLTCGDTTTDAKVNGVAVYQRTTSDFTVVAGYAGNFYEVEINWEAKGYIS